MLLLLNKRATKANRVLCSFRIKALHSGYIFQVGVSDDLSLSPDVFRVEFLAVLSSLGVWAKNSARDIAG